MHRSLLVAALLAVSSARHVELERNLPHTHPHQDEEVLEVMNFDIDNNFVVDSTTGIKYNPYSKHHPGRHVCANQKNVTQPVKTRQSFCKPTYKKYTQKCNDNQVCSGIRVVYETGYREIVTTRQSKQVHYYCCPGWKQLNSKSHGCNKPVCVQECLNGGACTKPDSCTCARGYIGQSCEHDVDECKKEKPCDQICVNTPGSYHCECRENYRLLSDGHSCKRDDDEIGFEAKEMQFEELDERIHKIETMLEQRNPDVVQRNFREFDDKLSNLSNDVGVLKSEIVQKTVYTNEMNSIKTRLLQLDKKSMKIDELASRYDKLFKRFVYKL